MTDHRPAGAVWPGAGVDPGGHARATMWEVTGMRIWGERQMKVHAVLEQEADGAWSAWVPALPGCATYGDTRDQAVEHLREAVKLYIESLTERGLPVPDLARDIAVEDVEVPV